MTRWLVTGAAGMLGRDVTAALSAAGEGSRVTALDRGALDITDAAETRDTVAGHDVVVNTAAWTDVDRAEDDESAAAAVNATGARNLAAACARHGARMLHVSTDYVFPGTSAEPCAEDAPTAPVNAYGRTKLAGEQAVRELLPGHGYTVRTAWLYGAHGRNFVSTVLRLAAQRDHLEVVDDQTGQPTWSYALATRLVALGRAAVAGSAPPGVYHGTAAGGTTWFGLAREVFALAGLSPERVRPVGTDRYPRRAPRPARSVLGHEGWARAGMGTPAPWRPMLAAAFAEGTFTHELSAVRGPLRGDGRPPVEHGGGSSGVDRLGTPADGRGDAFGDRRA